LDEHPDLDLRLFPSQTGSSRDIRPDDAIGHGIVDGDMIVVLGPSIFSLTDPPPQPEHVEFAAVSLDEFSVSVLDFPRIAAICFGPFGDVYTATDPRSNTVVAVKSIRWGLSERDRRCFGREVNILAQVNHPALLKLVGYCEPDDDRQLDGAIITDWYARGSLQGLIDQERRGETPPDWDATRKWIAIYGVAAGMNDLHQHWVIHRNLQASNVLVDDNLEPKVGGFGLAKIQDPDDQHQTSSIGSSLFTAPEIFENDEWYDRRVDVYAFGILVYQVVTNGDVRPGEMSQFQLIRQIATGWRPPIPDSVWGPYRDLIASCWHSALAFRPTFAHILAVMTRQAFLSTQIDVAAFAAYVSKVTPGMSIAEQRLTIPPALDPGPFYGDSAISEPPSLPGASMTALMLDPNDRKRDRTFKAKSSGQARVFRLLRPSTNEASAAKELNLDDESLFMRELQMLAQLRHPAIVGLIGYYAPDEDAGIKPTIITEWMSGGSLDGLLWSPDSPKISATMKMKIIVGIILGMRYIHACRVMHRDLKPQNILLTKECEPKIGDLGSARLTDVETSKTQTPFTILYMAPELAWGEEYGKEVDVFSFGIALWEILTGEKGFADLLAMARSSGMVVSRKIYEGARPKRDAKIVF
jgi:serine/threonine protein kinase